MSKRYNCYWVVSFLPTRTEVMINDRDSSNTLFTDLAVEIDCSYDSVEEYLAAIGLKIYSFECLTHRQATNYVGKGVFSEIFSEQSVRDKV